MARYIPVDVEVDLSDFDTEELIQELDDRGLRSLDYNTKYVDADEMRLVLESIWFKRRMKQDYQSELDQLIYGVLGKMS
jgi:hypothetical protein